MKKLINLEDILSMLHHFFVFLFEEITQKERCRKCGNFNMNDGYWNRAYNSLCRQAAGAKGKRCYDCGHIEWKTPNFDEWLAEMPEWIVPYKETVRPNGY